MSKEFNIFNNLDEMMKSNFLAQIRTMDAANVSNDSQNNSDVFEEFDSLPALSRNPTKRTQKQLEPKESQVETAKENAKNRRSSSSRERSFSPPMALLENLSSNLVDIPVSARTRRSLGRAQRSLDQTAIVPSTAKDTAQTNTTSGKARGGRGRGKGRGRGRRANANTSINTNGSFEECTISDNSSNHSNDSDYRNTQTPQTESISLNSNTSASSIMERFLDRGRQGRGRRLRRGMRSRRNYVAEVAARCQTIDTIDLISSPFPRVEGAITLNSDGEEELPQPRDQKKTKNEELDISLDDDNPELSVKINWKGKPEAFKLRKYQKFSNIFKLLAERENTEMENIVCNLNERIIASDDTPESIGYKIYHFIDGRVLTDNFNLQSGPITLPKKQRNANQINLKIQSDKWKRPLQINMLKSDKFRILYIKCSEELNVGIEKIKLSFDGENLEFNDTPTDLVLEGGEAIDLRIKE